MVTFVVRAWIPGEGQDGAPELKGTVEHIESGATAIFASEAALLGFMRAHLDPAPLQRS
jgi:hypothetical protein